MNAFGLLLGRTDLHKWLFLHIRADPLFVCFLARLVVAPGCAIIPRLMSEQRAVCRERPSQITDCAAAVETDRAGSDPLLSAGSEVPR